MERKGALGSQLESITRKKNASEETIEKILDDRLKQIIEEIKSES